MDDLELDKFEQKVCELILNTAVPGQHSARSAIRHMQRAWNKRILDREMAFFQAITAQEEAVTAVIHAVRRHRYVGWEKLRWRNHRHKWGLMALLEGIERRLEGGKANGFSLFLQIKMHEGQERVLPVIHHPSLGDYELFMYPPMSGRMTGPDCHLEDFSRQVEEVATGKGFPSVQKYINDLANLRNRLLYASADGIPNVSYADDLLLEFRKRLFSTLGIYLMIDPYPQHQEFVLQGLAAFLQMMELLGTSDYGARE